MTLHIIVICGSNQQILFSCLTSLQSQNISLAVTIIDNTFTINDFATLKQLARGFYRWNFIRNHSPQGFATNNNLGLRDTPSGTDYVLLLNDDTVIHEHALERMMEVICSNRSIGAINPLLLNPDGTQQWSEQHLRFPNEWRTILQIVIGHRLTSALLRAPDSPSWLSGACLMLRVSALQEVGALDEAYDPGYSEDVDLCYRLTRYGWQLAICNEAEVTHIGGMSFKAGSIDRYANQFRGNLRYISKWGSKPQQACTKLAWLVSIVSRIAISACLHGLHISISNQLPSPNAYLNTLKGYIYALKNTRS
jgi:GT2 family glycosyltransferase